LVDHSAYSTVERKASDVVALMGRRQAVEKADWRVVSKDVSLVASKVTYLVDHSAYSMVERKASDVVSLLAT